MSQRKTAIVTGSATGVAMMRVGPRPIDVEPSMGLSPCFLAGVQSSGTSFWV